MAKGTLSRLRLSVPFAMAGHIYYSQPQISEPDTKTGRRHDDGYHGEGVPLPSSHLLEIQNKVEIRNKDSSVTRCCVLAAFIAFMIILHQKNNFTMMVQQSMIMLFFVSNKFCSLGHVLRKL